MLAGRALLGKIKALFTACPEQNSFLCSILGRNESRYLSGMICSDNITIQATVFYIKSIKMKSIAFNSEYRKTVGSVFQNAPVLCLEHQSSLIKIERRYRSLEKSVCGI